MFLKCESYSDQAACVKSLVDTCSKIESALTVPPYDVRRVAMRNIADIARSAMFILNLLDSWHKGDEIIKKIIPQVLGLENPTDDSVKQAGDLIKKTSKLSFCLLTQFQIENCIAALLKAISGTNEKSFYSKANTLLVVKLDMVNDDVQTLNVAAEIRNSLHRNGIHRVVSKKQLPRWQFKIDPVEYIFEDGKRVQCADFEHIAHALEASVNVLKKVFEHPDIIQLKLVPDEYAAQITAVP